MSGSFAKKFGKLVLEKRNLAILSQDELAAKFEGTGTNKSRISDTETAKIAKPQSATIREFVRILEISKDELAACYGMGQEETLPLKLLQDIAERFDDNNRDASEDALVAYLKQTAKDWKALQARLAELEAADGNLSNLLQSAEGLLEAGKFAEADELLEDAEELQVTEKALKEATKSANIAQTRADAALLDGREVDAARHLTRAAGYLAGFDGDMAAGLRNDFAIRLWERGKAFGGVGLNEAIKLYSLNLAHWQLETDPANWAMTQNNLGNALRDQAMRVVEAAGAVLLTRAVAAFKAALQVYTRDAAPQDWAMTQNNIGNALGDQANRVEGATGADLLTEAVAAYKAALQVRTRDAAPQNWAATQNNLGNTLRDQAIRVEGAAGTDLLADAVAAFQAALQVYTRDATPQNWALTQNNLGNALGDQAMLVEAAAGADLLVEAVAAYKAALQVRTRDAAPQNWAETQENLGLLFELYATHSDDAVQELTKALGYFDAALEVYDRDHTPYYYNKCTALRDRVLAALDGMS